MRSAPQHDAVLVEGLGKAYANGTVALRDVSLRVTPGECYGLLGGDGAGKSTLAGILGTVVRPTSGRAVVAGFDVAAAPLEVRRLIGFAMQDVGLGASATARELLLLHGRLHGLSREKAAVRSRLLAELLELEGVAGKQLAELSGGTRRRVDLAATLIHLPTVAFFDEPTDGLDPHARVVVWDMLERLRRRLGVTIVLTTRDMDEADRLCDRIGLIERGRIVAEDTPARLNAAVARAA